MRVERHERRCRRSIRHASSVGRHRDHRPAGGELADVMRVWSAKGHGNWAAGGGRPEGQDAATKMSACIDDQ